MGGYWKNFRTVKEWIKESWNKKDCSKLCNLCKRTWKEILDGSVHMVPNEKFGRKSCDMANVFLCDECFKEWCIKNNIEDE